MIFLGYVLVLFTVAFLYLFVCVDERGGGVLAKAKIFFWIKMPEMLKDIARKCCGERFVWLIERVARYVCHEPNPLV